MLNIIVKKLSLEDPELAKALTIRKTVFVDEQHCPPELEYENDDKSTHFLATCNGEPCGAARWRKTQNGYKLERFAVLPNFRGKGNRRPSCKGGIDTTYPKMPPIFISTPSLSALNFYLHSASNQSENNSKKLASSTSR